MLKIKVCSKCEYLIFDFLISYFCFRHTAAYLLKQCNGRYDDYLVGKRLLSYTEIAAPDASENKFRMEDRLEAVSKFAKLLERSDEEAMDAISKILMIIKEVNQNDFTSI